MASHHVTSVNGDAVNLSGLAISHIAQTLPSRTVMAVTRGVISG